MTRPVYHKVLVVPDPKREPNDARNGSAEDRS